ncbi:hypothetical protein ElyMa_002183400 [Elysia marginata]|uniref:Terminase small subunit n=1 Tax=Elysia marginata TaxID=1093978 RepID=A0AAV4FR73_9GAST|nr:hypothetical protein ElyMa_002183400 [Elysia marginata]
MDVLEFDNPTFDRGEDDFIEDVPPINPQVDPPPIEDTIIGGGGGESVMSQGQRLIKDAVDDYYANLAEHKNLLPEIKDTTKFYVDREGLLRLKSHPEINLINARTGLPNALSTIASYKKGVEVILNDLGFPNRRRAELPAAAMAAFREVDQKLGEAEGSMDGVELKDMGQVAHNAEDALVEMETTLSRGGSLPLASGDDAGSG